MEWILSIVGSLWTAFLAVPVVFGAVSQTIIRRSGDMLVYDIIATADADTTSTQAHGMGAIPDFWFCPILQAPAALSLWSFVSDVTNVTGTKATTMGSGNAAAQVRVYVQRRR
jgi:hypothetical protein